MRHHRSVPLTTVVHTFDHLNNREPLLLTAIISAASKFFRPQYHRNLLEYTHVLLNRVMNAGECSIEAIQALLILVCFKEPTDKSAWIKIGMAVRLGYQHGWYRTRRSGLPEDELEMRWLLVSHCYLGCSCLAEPRIRSELGIVRSVTGCRMTDADMAS